MWSKDKVSIIVPVYNAEKYIGRAIDSVLEQNYSNFELILIDDGSIDSSLLICRKYAEQDKRIVVLTQENAGPASARNAGLQKVTGEYLAFVDADDALESGALEYLVDKMHTTNVDVCVYSWYDVWPDGSKQRHYYEDEEHLQNPEDFFVKAFQRHTYCGGGFPWNKIWRTSSIKRNGEFILFDPSLRLYEDFYWTVQNLDRTTSVLYEDRPLYNYYFPDTSISRTGDLLKRWEALSKGAQKIYQHIKKTHPTLQAKVKVWYWKHLVNYLYIKKRNHRMITKGEKKELTSFIVLSVKHVGLKIWLKYLYVLL